MRVFDLEAAKAGAPVCTDLSEPVRILCCDWNGEEKVEMISGEKYSE